MSRIIVRSETFQTTLVYSLGQISDPVKSVISFIQTLSGFRKQFLYFDWIIPNFNWFWGKIVDKTIFKKKTFWSKQLCCRTNCSYFWIEVRFSLVNTRFVWFLLIINPSCVLIFRLNSHICIQKYSNCFSNYPESRKIETASDKIESLENYNWRTRHSTNLVQCSFSSLSNSLETNFFIYFFLTSLRGFSFDFSTIFILCVTRKT